MRSAVRPAPENRKLLAVAETYYASVRAMADQFAAAGPGGEFAYASGPLLDPREPAAMLAAQWVREGRALAFQRREDGRLRYFVRKRALAVVAAEAEAARPASLDPESDEGRVYGLLRRCANLDQACPSHEGIAERLGLPSRKRAEYATRKLIERGLIRVDWPARTGPRVVTIVGTGKSTAATSGEKR